MFRSIHEKTAIKHKLHSKNKYKLLLWVRVKVPKRAIARRACYQQYRLLHTENCKQQTHTLEINESLTNGWPSERQVDLMNCRHLLFCKCTRKPHFDFASISSCAILLLARLSSAASKCSQKGLTSLASSKDIKSSSKRRNECSYRSRLHLDLNYSLVFMIFQFSCVNQIRQTRAERSYIYQQQTNAHLTIVK